jgi:hypothetical protein
MRKAKLVMLLSVAIFPILGWMIAMSDPSASIIGKVGLTMSVWYAIGLSIASAWATVMFLDEVR